MSDIFAISVENSKLITVPRISHTQNFNNMSKELLRRKLSEETTWRCGACSKPETGNVQFEIAHVNPSCNGGSDEYENLILLCQTCHAEYDSHIIRGNKLNRNLEDVSFWINKLKAHKKQWMETSGKFSKLELDCLFDLYKSYKEGIKAEEWIQCNKQKPLCLDFPEDQIVNYNFNISGKTLTLSRKAKYFHAGIDLYSIMVQKIYLYNFRNLFNNNLISKLDNDSGVIEGKLIDSCNIFLTNEGVKFCKNFEKLTPIAKRQIP